MANLNLEQIRLYMVEVAKEAGAMIVQARKASMTHVSKKNSADIVTETDQAVETLTQERLGAKYPEFAFVGEESYKAGVAISNAPTFIVDPIDGTSNFVHGFPAVAVSIGLVVNRESAVGVVYNPFYQELWSAAKGLGATVQLADGEPLSLPLVHEPLRGLGPACIGLEWGSDREGPNFDLNIKVFTTLARTLRTGGRFANSLRATGSAAITICRVAAGQQDMFWECGCWAWDVAAAWCILSEAGGLMVDGHPGCWNPPIDNRRYLAVRPAAAGEGQREFVEEFWSIIGEDRSSYGPPGPSGEEPKPEQI